ncbi:MAG: hypothetical protein IT373_14575, partial [Polyangiaceae bacterium]|nr:hypothetical protein [Polyangiaceae bacterium]
MAPTTICTFNANNLYARYRFGQTYPGDRSGKSRVGEGWGYLPQYDAGSIELLQPQDCKLLARVITDDGARLPDVVCLQEVESLLALRRFNEEFLGGAYSQALVIDSRDFRQIDVGVLSRLDVAHVRTHVDARDPAAPDPARPWLFSRDCLEVGVALNKSGSKVLTLFVNHLKSKYAESAADRAKADATRTRQAEGVRRLVQARFSVEERKTALFAV